MVNYSFRIFGLLLIMIFILGACTGKRKARMAIAKSTESVLSDSVVLRNNLASEFEFMNLNLKGDGKFKNKKEKWTFAYRIYMVKDSLIWCSITKFGMEWVRMQITEDSIQILDRSGKNYITADYTLLREKSGMDINFNTLENILTGNTGFMQDSLRADIKSNIPHRFLGRRDSTQFAFILSADNFKINQMEAENQHKNQKTFLSYANYETLEGYQLPAYFLLNVIKPERNQIELIHTRMERNSENFSVSFSIPENYARLQIQ